MTLIVAQPRQIVFKQNKTQTYPEQLMPRNSACWLIGWQNVVQYNFNNMMAPRLELLLASKIGQKELLMI